MTDRIERAKQFDRAAHDSINQKRKYSGVPYWVHTDEVASIVAQNVSAFERKLSPRTEAMIMAAHLHDIIEDVNSFPYNYDGIVSLFGDEVANLVLELTDEFTKDKYPKLNRSQRKAAENERLFKISKEAKVIKLADMLSSTKDIIENDPEFAKVYIVEAGQKIIALEHDKGCPSCQGCINCGFMTFSLYCNVNYYLTAKISAQLKGCGK